ncbi:uncharacterized protein UHOD_08983 [Ustilago sp. UG-2017b]|nr:uncharacterized protein UHOD_08983 [Ustilago sp. UG-2017b]
MLRLHTLITACCLLLLSALAASAQSTSGDSLFADSACSSNLCLRVVYSPSEKRYNMTMTASGGGAPIGWHAVGTGSQMDKSNMMIGWVDTAGNVVMSQRTTSGHDTPSTSITALAANLEHRFSFSNSSGTVWAWSFPLSASDPAPSTTTPFIWASNKNDNPAASTTASIRRHNAYGFFNLDLTKPYDSASSSSSASGSGSLKPGSNQNRGRRILDKRNNVIIAHMVFMIVAWFLLVPAGILIGRYGRTMFKWFPVHRAVMATAFLFVLIGFIIIVAQTSSSGGEHFDSTHARAGLAIFIIMILQSLLGVLGHKTKRFNPSRIVHVVIGLGVTVLAIWNATEGLSLWSWGAPRWAGWILWVWASLLALAYLAGLAFLPRDLRQWRAEQRNSQEKQHHSLGLGEFLPGRASMSTKQGSPTHQPGSSPLQTAPSRAYQTYSQQAHAPGNRI